MNYSQICVVRPPLLSKYKFYLYKLQKEDEKRASGNNFKLQPPEKYGKLDRDEHFCHFVVATLDLHFF